MNLSYTLYAKLLESITHEQLLAEQRRDGMFFARAEESGSEGCYVEVARWSDARRRWERYAFLKFLNGDDPQFPFCIEAAGHYADEINGKAHAYTSIIHRMPNWVDHAVVDCAAVDCAAVAVPANAVNEPVIEYQTYGVDAYGHMTHCGPHSLARFDQAAAQKLQDDWEIFAGEIAAKWPDCPTAKARGTTVAIRFHPIGHPELCREFPIEQRARKPV